MAPMYTVSIYDSAGVLKAISQDYTSLQIAKAVNAPDAAVLTYNINDAFVDQFLSNGAIIEILREDTAAGISATTEFSGIIRRVTRTYAEQNIIEVMALGMLDILRQRVIAYKAGILNRSKYVSVPAEQIIKNLFNYNVNVQATTANGRALNGTITGMNTTASAGTGNVLSLECAYANLLSTMQDVADAGGGDFSLTYTAPASWLLTWHLGQLGTDRTATVRLSVPLGTVGELVVDFDRVDDFNAVIVGGTGEGAARLVATRPASLPTGLSLREKFVDAKSQKKSAIASLQALGTSVLVRERKRREYSATLLQNAALRYGRDYFIGDLVTILWGTTTVTQKIVGVDLSFSADGKESVDVSLAPNS